MQLVGSGATVLLLSYVETVYRRTFVMRFIITHARFDAQVTIDLPAGSTRAERNHIRAVLRHAERGRLAGNNE